jgi:hypothetical protein
MITSYLVEPQDVFVGHVVTVGATATGLGDAGVDFLWTAPQGFFEDPASAATVYICSQPGTVDVALRVESGGCTDTIATVVVCTTEDAG